MARKSGKASGGVTFLNIAVFTFRPVRLSGGDDGAVFEPETWF